jgi:rare lipoprotein A
MPLLCVAALVSCAGAPKRGAFYQDDGPPDRVPADLYEIADAVPRVEPLLSRANRPYTALGRSYTPLTGDVPFRQRGVASWYGKQFHGNRTASGEIYDMFAMTAAHPTLPIPSYVRVSNPRNGRTVIVRVNDRGPFKDNRVIDLSYAAASRLGIAAAGTAEVEVERLTSAQIASGAWRRGSQAARDATPPAADDAASSTSTVAVSAVPAAPADNAAAGTVSPVPASASGGTTGGAPWSVQVGAFSQQSNAETFAARVAAVLGFSEADLAAGVTVARVEHRGGLFRVLVGTLPDRAQAQSLAQQLEQLLGRPAVPFAR